MLPSPLFQLTVPSIHDSLPLDVRLYHPRLLTTPSHIAQVRGWSRRAVLLAHPYAPMGGCYDDPVIGIVGKELLRAGWIVCTFNFRGAAGSKGSTSWTSKAEQADYASVMAFLVYYMHHLDVELHTCMPRTPGASSYSQGTTDSCTKSTLLFGGYSYGSMVLTSLSPDLASIISPFQTPLPQSSHAEIRLRAQNLASTQATVTADLLCQTSFADEMEQQGMPGSPGRSHRMTGMRTGGDEDIRRSSGDGHHRRSSLGLDRHTPDRIRQSLERSRDKISSKQARGQRSTPDLPAPTSAPQSSTQHLQPVNNIHQTYRTAYLLISPIHGLIRSLASLWTFNRSAPPSLATSPTSLSATDLKFLHSPTLAIFGDDDTFTSISRYRAWVAALDAAAHPAATFSTTNFTHVVVPRAGHFWIDEDAEMELRRAVGEFAASLTGDASVFSPPRSSTSSLS